MADTKRSKSRSATRAALLRAASQVVIDKGVEALTLDAVAQQAGVSKGGLLYHFPNKDALMTSMVEQLIQDFEVVLQTEFDQDDAPGTPGQWVRAYIRATLRFSKQSLALVARLSSIAANSPDLFESAKVYEQQSRQRIETSGIDPIKATIILLAADGLWLSEVFQVGTLEEPQLIQVVETLLAMTRSPESAS
ncbi:TetR family transcriptional regulator [Leptolyngbya sp. FACHB-541]|uniref:TetR/AcrR family transcriptional regulator n=1 Tax=Leptolyngbya sp. FACHB-541 TaxID=2692810 RepID=UPI0016898417|nr:TetR/AcrR family transcriptional regulator [Leptolyngbya sp. FACHB-541]MBD2000603.1 TetR family transcriptional regulator [Leptolyngbya sp. FACHB-541]